VSTCNACGGTVLFGRTTTANNKPIPLDPQRHERDDERANVAVSRNHLGSLLARVLKDGEQPERHEWRAMPHFATCPKRAADADAKAGRIPDVIPFPKGGRR